MKTSTITSKGQVTIPKEVRNLLHLQPGDRIEFRIGDRDGVRIVPVARPAADLFGLLHRPDQPAAGVEAMERSLVEEVTRQHEAGKDA